MVLLVLHFRTPIGLGLGLRAMFFHDESSTTKGGYESAIALYSVSSHLVSVSYLFYGMV